MNPTKTIPAHKGTWLGVLPKLLGQDPYEYLKTVMQNQGDFVKLDFIAQPVYLVSNPDYVQYILRDNYQNFRKPGALYDSAKEFSGNGLVTSTGDLWLRQRRMIQPQLHRKQLFNLFEEMLSAISDGLNPWTVFANNHETIDLNKKIAEITITIITRTMFGRETLQPAEISRVGEAIGYIVRYVGEGLFTNALPKWIPKPGAKEFRENLQIMRNAVQQIIEKCRTGKVESASLIKMLIGLVDEETNQGMSEQQLFDEVMTIFTAGYETTATALTWLFIALQDNPHVLEKLEKEIKDVLGDREPSFEDVHKLSYTRQVFMEVLRMYTIVPFLPRANNEADHIGDYPLPANSMVLVFYHGVHHNPQIWKNPEVFDPERFAPENMENRHPYAFIPFSAGPRKCAGDDFAMLEGPLVMAMILKKFKVQILPGQNFESRLGATMRPAHGVMATVEFK